MTSRREFLRRSIGIGALAALPWGDASAAIDHPLRLIGSAGLRGTPPRPITPNSRFFTATYSGYVPNLGWARYRLYISGRVKRTLALSMADLEQLSDRREYVTLECIRNPVGGDAIGTALWEGVSLHRVIEMAAPRATPRSLAVFGHDGYSESLPFNRFALDDAMLAWRMNGRPLPVEHGYPLRLIVPGFYGLKSVKWVSMIELLEGEFSGYWPRQGLQQPALLPLRSQILLPIDGAHLPPGRYIVSGIADGGRRGVGRVELSLDGGSRWRPAALRPPLSKWTWVAWQSEWHARRPGSYRLRVRAVDRAGRPQHDGASVSDRAHHTITVNITGA